MLELKSPVINKPFYVYKRFNFDMPVQAESSQQRDKTLNGTKSS
jgi:hypothetical protein